MTEQISPQPVSDLQHQYGPQCRVCGSVPAVDVTFRGHRGLILLMQFLKEQGPFCRDCGISVFRTMTSRTLVQGWWGWGSFIITPIVLLMNLVKRGKVAGLAAPTSPSGQPAQTLPVGKPVYLRPTMIGLLVPLAAVAFIGAAVISGPTTHVGDCVKARTSTVDFVSCSQSNDGKVLARVDNEDQCPDGTEHVVEQTRNGRITDIFCVD